MQRITRLPLLIDAVMTRLKLDDGEFDDWKMALAIMNKVCSLIWEKKSLLIANCQKSNVLVCNDDPTIRFYIFATSDISFFIFYPFNLLRSFLSVMKPPTGVNRLSKWKSYQSK